jgi:hypothetical protein
VIQRSFIVINFSILEEHSQAFHSAITSKVNELRLLLVSWKLFEFNFHSILPFL